MSARRQCRRGAGSGAARIIAVTGALMLVAAPAAAALPRISWLPICSADGAHWIALPDDPLRQKDPVPGGHPPGGCVHSLCPGAQRPGGKVRWRR